MSSASGQHQVDNRLRADPGGDGTRKFRAYAEALLSTDTAGSVYTLSHGEPGTVSCLMHIYIFYFRANMPSPARDMIPGHVSKWPEWTRETIQFAHIGPMGVASRRMHVLSRYEDGGGEGERVTPISCVVASARGGAGCVRGVPASRAGFDRPQCIHPPSARLGRRRAAACGSRASDALPQCPAACCPPADADGEKQKRP